MAFSFSYTKAEHASCAHCTEQAIPCRSFKKGDRKVLTNGSLLRQVNGKDLANASHEETVRAFHAAEEPILVEVLRRPSASVMSTSSISDNYDQHPTIPTTNTVGTQTDPQASCCCHQMLTIPGPPPASSICDISAEDDVTTDVTWMYEEISLHRTSVHDKIGLTVFYEPTSEHDVTEIYVGRVEPDSLAGRDGRIQECDMIVKINDCEVKNRQQAIQLFSESRSDINLLVCRPASLASQSYIYDDDFITADICNSDSIDLHDFNAMPLIEEERADCQEDDTTLADTASLPSYKDKDGKDSGVGHDSSHASEQELDSSHDDSVYNHVEDKEAMVENMETRNRFRELLEARCNELVKSSGDRGFSPRVIHPHYHVEKPTATQDTHRSVPRMGTRIMQSSSDICTLPRSDGHDTAYNTAESCNSMNNTIELTKNQKGSMLSLNKCGVRVEETRHKRKSRKTSKDKKAVLSSQTLDNNSNVADSHVAYTTEDKLAETIAAQQKLLLDQSRTSTLKKASLGRHMNNSKPIDQHESDKMEWVLKRRPDGSRYVTKRPIRTKMLCERKKQLENERCGLTTDDDTMSELKLGRHWSKEDRKRHYRKAKEYHQRKMTLHEKVEVIKRSTAYGGQAQVLQLRHKKLEQQAIKDLDFITVQELLAHRGNISLPCNNLISVTTV